MITNTFHFLTHRKDTNKQAKYHYPRRYIIYPHQKIFTHFCYTKAINHYSTIQFATSNVHFATHINSPQEYSMKFITLVIVGVP